MNMVTTSAEEKVDIQTLIRQIPTQLAPDDVRPLRIRRRKHSPSPPLRRSVFQSSSDWAAPSTTTVLDAFHQSLAQQLADNQFASNELSLSRAAGSVGVDATMADIFQAHSARPIPYRSKSRGLDRNILQCSTCMRPVLLSRFLHHMALCAAQTDKRTSYLERLHPSDNLLLTAPYLPDSQLCQQNDNFLHPPAPDHANLPKLHTSPRVVQVKEDDDWKSSLISLAPTYTPRGSFNKRRRVSLPPLSESSSQRKKNVNIERKALSAAAAMGMVPPPALPETTKEENRICTDVASWGSKAPWAKLMQIAMPVTLSRAPKRKFVSPRNSPSQTAVQVGTAKSRTESDKSATVQPSVPSLAGSLLCLRGHGSKELTNTSLHYMDIPQTPLARSGAMFHGQTYVAPMGTFETDPRAPTAIKMPLANAVVPTLQTKVTTPNGTAQRFITGDPRTKKVIVPTATTGNSNQVAKKQRPAKQRPAVTSNVGNNAPTQAKQNVAPQRKMGGRLSPSLTPNPKLPTSTVEAQQRLAANRNAAQISASAAAASVAANASAVATANFPPVSAPQKKAYRPVSGTNYAATARVAAGQGMVVGPGMNAAAAQLASRTATRVVKGRSHSGVATSAATSVARASKPAKSHSPGQTGSRGSERVAATMHRANAVSPGYESVLMAANASNAASRMNALRASTGAGSPFDFQQVMAQVAANGAHRPRDDNGNLARAAIADIAKGPLVGNEKLAGQMSRQGMRGISPQARLKQAATNAHNTQVRLTPGHKGNGRQQVRVQGRKDDRDVHGKQDIGSQLRQVEAMQNEAVASSVEGGVSGGGFGKRGDVVNVGASQGFYNGAALAAATNQASSQAMKNQRMALMQMNQAIPNAAGIGGQNVNAQNVLQNLHDMRPLQNLGVVGGMQGAGHNNVLSFLPGGGLSTGAGAVMASGSLPPAPNGGRSAGDFLQQLLAGQGGMHNGQVNQVAGALNPHVLVTRAMNIPQQQQQRGMTGGNEPSALTADIDRALTISFDESDLLD